MKAMIFAAGLGTRLRPVTDTTPKALVQVAGKPMLQRTIEHLKAHHFAEIIVNAHHHADQVVDFVKNYPDTEVSLTLSDERDLLLDTGGGLKKASWFFDDQKPFLVINADIISDLDLTQLYRHHEEKKALATLVVRERESSRGFLFDENMQMAGWQNKKTGEQKITRQLGNFRSFPFSGIHVLDPQIFDLMEENGKFSIVDVYMRLSVSHTIVAYPDENSTWFDIGDAEKLRKAEASLTS